MLVNNTSPGAHKTQFYSRFWLIRSVLKYKYFLCFCGIKNVIMGFYTIPLGLNLILLTLLMHHVLICDYVVFVHRITDKGSVPETRACLIFFSYLILVIIYTRNCTAVRNV